MTNNINLVELLKDCKNQIFWSDLFGDVTVEIEKDPSRNDYFIIIKPVDSFLYETLNQFGQISNTIKDCPCILWPSQDNKSWENWIVNNAPWKIIKSHKDALKYLGMNETIHSDLSLEQYTYIILTNIRDAINQGDHILNVTDSDHYFIDVVKSEIIIQKRDGNCSPKRNYFLSFKSKDRAEYFKNQFEHLIKSYFIR